MGTDGVARPLSIWVARHFHSNFSGADRNVRATRAYFFAKALT